MCSSSENFKANINPGEPGRETVKLLDNVRGEEAGERQREGCSVPSPCKGGCEVRWAIAESILS